jgi:hypothetical protein
MNKLFSIESVQKTEGLWSINVSGAPESGRISSENGILKDAESGEVYTEELIAEICMFEEDTLVTYVEIN